MFDENGNLLPFMLSDLVTISQAALAKYGDMPVWVRASYLGYDDTIVTTAPVSEPPVVNNTNLSWLYGYQTWSEKYPILSFLIESETV